MSDRTGISWCDASWNPVRGCKIVSPGCENCYAMKTAARFSGVGNTYEGLTKKTSRGPVWTGEVREIPHKLEEPLHWKKPRRIFVNSMSDLFHEDVSDEFLNRVFAVMALAPWHTFQVLTKRSKMMRDYFADEWCWAMIEGAAQKLYADRTGEDPSMWLAVHELPNLWLGISTEDQLRLEERAPDLLETHFGGKRWISAEPLLSDLQFRNPSTAIASYLDGLDWLVVGGESGPKARPCHVEWIRDIHQQCKAASVPLFVKQDSGHRAGQQGRIPDEIWIQEFPA